ncbi:nitrilase-related carbon-nitrogen hydrolase [Trinickia sp. YCB016]
MSSSLTPMLRVASIPLVSRCGDTGHNVSRIVASLERAARDGVGLAVFPETCLTGYSSARIRYAELEALAERIDGASVDAVADAAERTRVAAGVGLIERAPGGQLFNSYVICLPDGQRHCHRKLHAFEHRRLANGERFTVFDTHWGVRIGILIGSDNYLVENARMTALMGATLLVAPHRRDRADRANREVDCALHAVATTRGVASDWMRRSLPARAFDNGMFVVCSEGADAGDGEASLGAALIVDPCGCIVAESAGERRDFIAADIDPGLSGASIGQHWLATRRPELYGQLARTERRARVAFEPQSASARGSVPISFAVVRRTRSDM